MCYNNAFFTRKDAILEQKDILDKLIKTIIKDERTEKLTHYLSESSLAKTLNLSKKTPREDWQSLFTWIEDYLHYSVNTAHPNFNNRMWSGANLPSILGEIITAFYNTSNCTYESAPVASLIEKYMIDEMFKTC